MRTLLSDKHPQHDKLMSSKYKNIIIAYLEKLKKIEYNYMIKNAKYMHTRLWEYTEIHNERESRCAIFKKLTPYQNKIYKAIKFEVKNSKTKSKYIDTPCINVDLTHWGFGITFDELILYKNKLIVLNERGLCQAVIENKDNIYSGEDTFYIPNYIDILINVD